MTPQQFIDRIAPIAQKLRREGSHIFPSIRVAQAALETGWKIPSWNNMVGFKVGSGKTNAYWKGAYVNKGTWEVYDDERVDVKANFRAYDTIDDSFRDQDILFSIDRYKRVRKARSAEDQAYALYACGYATDPQYATKLLSIVEKYKLLQYNKVNNDKGSDDKLTLTEWQWTMLEEAVPKLNLDSPGMWLEKVQKRELTASELAWLSIIIHSRYQYL